MSCDFTFGLSVQIDDLYDKKEITQTVTKYNEDTGDKYTIDIKKDMYVCKNTSQQYTEDQLREFLDTMSDIYLVGGDYDEELINLAIADCEYTESFDYFNLQDSLGRFVDKLQKNLGFSIPLNYINVFGEISC